MNQITSEMIKATCWELWRCGVLTDNGVNNIFYKRNINETRSFLFNPVITIPSINCNQTQPNLLHKGLAEYNTQYKYAYCMCMCVINYIYIFYQLTA
jgi:hypothetical protein